MIRLRMECCYFLIAHAIHITVRTVFNYSLQYSVYRWCGPITAQQGIVVMKQDLLTATNRHWFR